MWRILKKFAVPLASIVPLGLLVACGSTPNAGFAKLTSETDKGPITFVSWGGTTQQAQQKYWADTFTKKTGISVIQAGPTDYGKFKAMVESHNVSWDVVDVEADFAYKAAKEGLLEPLNFQIINYKHLDKDFVFKYGVGDFEYSFVDAYNKQKFGKNPPHGWADFFNTKKYPGMRTVYEWPTIGVLEAALLAEGTPSNKLYPLNVKKAFNKLNQLKPSIVWWTTGAQSQQLMASGNTDLGFVWNGRMYYLIQQGAPIGIDWTQNIKEADFLVVPKGSKHVKAAMEFIANALDPRNQADFTNATSYGPVNQDALRFVKKSIVPYLPSSHKLTQVVLNAKWWAYHEDAVEPQWNAWLLQKK
ncbi:MAG: ABC transporter substrate-binding protein [Alicyclobacillus sp.]|nr:ABC transporter substrate-binding protein [Alicyclobacillus sp.]